MLHFTLKVGVIKEIKNGRAPNWVKPLQMKYFCMYVHLGATSRRSPLMFYILLVFCFLIFLPILYIFVHYNLFFTFPIRYLAYSYLSYPFSFPPSYLSLSPSPLSFHLPPSLLSLPLSFPPSLSLLSLQLLVYLPVVYKQ